MIKYSLIFDLKVRFWEHGLYKYPPSHFWTFWSVLSVFGVFRYFAHFGKYCAFWDILRVFRYSERFKVFWAFGSISKKKLALKSISSVYGYVKPFVLKNLEILNVQKSIWTLKDILNGLPNENCDEIEK